MSEQDKKPFNTATSRITGNLAADPEFHDGNQKRATFTIYQNWRRREKVGENYELVDGKAQIRCTAWGDTAEFIEDNLKYFSKGNRVIVEGPILYGTYKGKLTVDLGDGDEVEIEIDKESKELTVNSIQPYTFRTKKDSDSSSGSSTAARVVKKVTHDEDSTPDVDNSDDSEESEAPRRRRRRVVSE